MIKFESIDTEIIELVLSKVTVTKDNCYLFPYVMNNGYPQLQVNNQHILVHRLMKSFASKRDLKEGLVVHHTCGNRNCVNPAHLRIMTPKEHMQLHNTRLTDSELFIVFKEFFNSNLTLKELSSKLKDKYGIEVSYSYISQLVNGKVRTGLYDSYYSMFNSID